jgi:septum formation protein
MLILASQSAARKALLAQAGLQFEVQPAEIDERALEGAALASGKELALHLAEYKALAVSKRCPGDLVIGADQTLTLGTTLFHKPRNLDEARDSSTGWPGKPISFVPGWSSCATTSCSGQRWRRPS